MQLSRKSDLVLVDVADEAAVAAHDAPVVAALGDGAVRAGCAGGHGLPYHVAVVAETELAGTVADDSTVGSAGAAAAAAATSCGSGSGCSA